jgi:hypothetical protein
MPKCCTEMPSEELAPKALEINILCYFKMKGMEL